jgi:hypothetical protein
MNKNLIGLVALACSLFGFGLFVGSAAPAQAAGGTTSCQDGVVCYVESQARGDSGWQNTIKPAPGGGSSGGSSGSVQNPTKKLTFDACVNWNNGGHINWFGEYPVKESGTMNCAFRRGDAPQTKCPPVSDRAAKGRMVVYVQDPATQDWVYAYFYCLYPTDAYAPIERPVGSGKIYTGGQGDFFQTPNAAVANQLAWSGVKTDSTGYVDRGVDLANPEPWAGTWQPDFKAKTGVTSAGDPLYGYYRLVWKLDYRNCTSYGYPAWLQQPIRYDCAQRGSDTTFSPYTYACDTNPPLQAGIRNGAIFIPSQCIGSWNCVFESDTTIGGQPEALTVMRNGQGSPVKSAKPGIRVSDGSRISAIRNWQTYRTVTPGSTPSMAYVKSSWKWDTWQAFKADETIAFNWASDSKGHPFSWSTRYRFTANFLVPRQADTTGGVSYVWVTQTPRCLEDISPKVEALRATNR